MRLVLNVFAAAALMLAPAAACDRGGALEVQDLTDALEAKIQARVLDAILGRGAASVFLELKVELESSREEHSRSGTGEARTKLPEETADTGGRKTQDQTAIQAKGSSEKKTVLGLAPAAMKLRVLHDAAVPPEKLKAARDALETLFRGKLKSEDIVFVPAVFVKGS